MRRRTSSCSSCRLALAAIAYGVKGGVASGLVAAGLGCAWWLQHGDSGGTWWLVSRGLTVLLVGGLLGWVADSRQALTRELEKQRELSLDLIATATLDGFFTRVNPAFTGMLGYTSEELLATPFSEFVHPDDRAATRAARVTQAETGVEILNFQNRCRTKDGSYRWLEWTSRPDPSRRELVVVGRDITDRKLLEGNAEQRDKEAKLERTVAEPEPGSSRRRGRRRSSGSPSPPTTTTTKPSATPAGSARPPPRSRRHSELPEHDVALIRRGPALLHDVGWQGRDHRRGAPHEARQGSLPTSSEHVKQHAEMGARILSWKAPPRCSRAAETIARFHHERWDGTRLPAWPRGGSDPPLRPNRRRRGRLRRDHPHLPTLQGGDGGGADERRRRRSGDFLGQPLRLRLPSSTPSRSSGFHTSSQASSAPMAGQSHKATKSKTAPAKHWSAPKTCGSATRKRKAARRPRTPCETAGRAAT